MGWEGSREDYEALFGSSGQNAPDRYKMDDDDDGGSSSSGSSGGSSRYGGYSGNSRTKETLGKQAKKKAKKAAKKVKKATSSSSSSGSSDPIDTTADLQDAINKNRAGSTTDTNLDPDAAEKKNDAVAKATKQVSETPGTGVPSATSTMVDYSKEFEDPDYGAGGVPDFADDASFGGSGDDYVVSDPTTGGPLLADTANAADWLRDSLAGESSVGDEDHQGVVPGLSNWVSDGMPSAPGTTDQSVIDSLTDAIQNAQQTNDSAPTPERSGLSGLLMTLLVGAVVLLGLAEVLD